MKRQLITLGLLAASVMSVATVQSSATAATITTNEIEGGIKSAGTLHQTGDQYVFAGSLGFSDREDNFTFNVPEKGEHVFAYNPDSTIQNGKLSVFQGSQKLISLNPGITFKRILEPGVYRLVIEGQNNSSPKKYTGHVITPKVTSRKISVELISAQARDNFDSRFQGRAADFFVETTMDSSRKPNTSVDGNNNNPRFNYRASHVLPKDQNLMLIKLSLKDEDKGSSDDLADINPSTKAHDITLRYIPTTGKIFNTSDNKLVGRAGVPFSLAGTNGPKATLNLMIGHNNQ